jgi:hypothetical protein
LSENGAEDLKMVELTSMMLVVDGSATVGIYVNATDVGDLVSEDRPFARHLGGGQFHCNDKVEIVVHEWLNVQELHLCHERIFKLMSRWEKYISVLRNYFKKMVLLWNI